LVDWAVAKGARQAAACDHLGISERTLQRWQLSAGDARHGPHSAPANKLSDVERQLLVAMANSAQFRDVSPKQIVPSLADAGLYLGSESTFYRVLKAENLMAHRGRAKAPVPRPKPEPFASGPNQVWTWDISYLRTSVRGDFFYLYMVVDIFSRRIVGWGVYDEESSALSSALIARASLAAGSASSVQNLLPVSAEFPDRRRHADERRHCDAVAGDQSVHVSRFHGCVSHHGARGLQGGQFWTDCLCSATSFPERAQRGDQASSTLDPRS
jgi:hypothetical protein